MAYCFYSILLKSQNILFLQDKKVHDLGVDLPQQIICDFEIRENWHNTLKNQII